MVLQSLGLNSASQIPLSLSFLQVSTSFNTFSTPFIFCLIFPTFTHLPIKKVKNGASKRSLESLRSYCSISIFWHLLKWLLLNLSLRMFLNNNNTKKLNGFFPESSNIDLLFVFLYLVYMTKNLPLLLPVLFCPFQIWYFKTIHSSVPLLPVERPSSVPHCDKVKQHFYLFFLSFSSFGRSF